ncbi:MAG: hypothetical protein ACT4NU_08650 [Chromatiales bacterium]
MSSIAPESLLRRSFVYRKLLQLGAQFAEMNGAAIAQAFGNSAAETEQARKLALCDLSPLAHSGLKGPGAAEWLATQGVAVPPAVNRATQQTDGALVARIGTNDLMVLSDLSGQSTLPARLDEAWMTEPVPPDAPRGFPVPRQDGFCWFAVTGKHADAMLAKLCGVDLRPHKFQVGEIAQTSVARLSAVVIRNDLNATLAYYLFADSASAEYWWDCLIDAIQEFSGTPVGLKAVQSL